VRRFSAYALRFSLNERTTHAQQAALTRLEAGSCCDSNWSEDCSLLACFGEVTAAGASVENPPPRHVVLLATYNSMRR
jgi:hypothetical protein